ncbi:hypothetical protein ACIP5Y_23315 [Nocardia sp. NPDC088792]|uniref:DUF7144 family membrane protein n=1 Tax=Nocardia sp. NPDC088792 TaxID=3364332 RepID=UPI0037FDE01F
MSSTLQADPAPTRSPTFSGVLILSTGVLQLVAAAAALAGNGGLLIAQNPVHPLDITRWSWFLALIGVLVIISGVGILAKKPWAYLAGIGMAAISAADSFVFASFCPLFALLVISIDILVICTLMREFPAACP